MQLKGTRGLYSQISSINLPLLVKDNPLVYSIKHVFKKAGAKIIYPLIVEYDKFCNLRHLRGSGNVGLLQDSFSFFPSWPLVAPTPTSIPESFTSHKQVLWWIYDKVLLNISTPGGDPYAKNLLMCNGLNIGDA